MSPPSRSRSETLVQVVSGSMNLRFDIDKTEGGVARFEFSDGSLLTLTVYSRSGDDPPSVGVFWASKEQRQETERDPHRVNRHHTVHRGVMPVG